MKKGKLKKSWSITTFVAITVTVTQFSSILFTPSLPKIMEALGVSIGTVQASIALFSIGFSLSALICGPLSDHYGRKSVIMISMACLLFGTAIILVSDSIIPFLTGRFIQGMGGAGPSVAARAVMRDQYKAHELSKIMSTRIMIIGIAPTIAPLLGGYLQKWFDWKGAFYFLLFYILSMSVLTYFLLPETNMKKPRYKFSFQAIFHSYLKVLSNAPYICFVLCVLLSFSCQIIYLTIAPFIFQGTLGFTPAQYGLLIMLPAGGYIIGGGISRFLHKFMHALTQMLLAILILLLTGGIWLIISLLGYFSILSTIIPLIVSLICVYIIFSNATAGMLKPFPETSGTASAFSSFMQMLGSGMIGVIISVFHFTSAESIASFYIINSIILMTLCLLIVRMKKHSKWLEKKIEMID